MGDITALIQLDYTTVFLGVFVLLFAFKGVIMLKDYFFERFGIETKKMREKRADHELLIKTSQNLALLQEKHESDNEVSNQHDSELKEQLSEFIEEMKKTTTILEHEMQQFTYNRIHDREQSRNIQAELKDSILAIAESNANNNNQIKELTDLFVDKEINDYRWEIINVADEISNGKFVSKERLKHAIATHSKYEEIIEKYNLTNGEVEISIQVINEAYKKKLLENAN